MFQMKSLLIFASIFCNLCLGAEVTNFLGERLYNDVLLFANYRDDAPRHGWSETVFPDPYDWAPQFIITYIEHSVANLDDKPYTLDIISGGIGHMNVTLHVTQEDKGEYEYYDYGFQTGWLKIYGVHKSCYENQ